MKVTKIVRLQELGGELESLTRRIGEASYRALCCDRMVEVAKSLCPVDTGALRASIRAEKRGPNMTVLAAGGEGFINPSTGRVVDYAGFVHDGTSRMAPRPFLMQAILEDRLPFAKELVERTAEGL